MNITQQRKFIQLSSAECQYLIELIEELDSETTYTEMQRGFTLPKLKRILTNPESLKLIHPDVEYLLDLLEDDDLPETQKLRDETMLTLLEIQKLQKARFAERELIEREREARRLRRLERKEAK